MVIKVTIKDINGLFACQLEMTIQGCKNKRQDVYVVLPTDAFAKTLIPRNNIMRNIRFPKTTSINSYITDGNLLAKNTTA